VTLFLEKWLRIGQTETEERLTRTLLLATVIPFTGNVVHLLGLSSLDLAPFGSVVSGVFVLAGIARCARLETLFGPPRAGAGMTIHSDWGDWLPRAVADAEPDGVALWYLGCNGFVLKSAGGTTVFIDPYFGTGDPPRTVRMVPVPMDPADIAEADAVFATHEHTDHVHGPSQAPIVANTGADFYAPDASLDVVREEAWRERWDVDPGGIERVDEGDAVRVGDLTVHVEPADVAFGTVGMVLDSDTREPERTRWYNDENMAIEAANELRLDRLVPTHWDMWRGLTADPTALHHHASSFEYPEELEILRIGDRLSV